MLDTNPGVSLTAVAEPIATGWRRRLGGAGGWGTNVSSGQILPESQSVMSAHKGTNEPLTLLEPRRSVRAVSRAGLSTQGPRTAGTALLSTWDACPSPPHPEAGVRLPRSGPQALREAQWLRPTRWEGRPAANTDLHGPEAALRQAAFPARMGKGVAAAGEVGPAMRV